MLGAKLAPPSFPAWGAAAVSGVDGEVEESVAGGVVEDRSESPVLGGVVPSGVLGMVVPGTGTGKHGGGQVAREGGNVANVEAGNTSIRVEVDDRSGEGGADW